MIDEKTINIIRIARTNKIGSVGFHNLAKIYNNNYEMIIDVICDKFDVPPKEQILREMDSLHRNNGKIITSIDDEYPWMLKLTDDHPPFLSVFGDLSNEIYKKNRIISIVGTRNCSIHGYKFAEYLAKELSMRDFIVVSGLANGIDSAAHNASLVEKKQTIAVVGSGLLQCYPNKSLANQIVQNNGVIISELEFDEGVKIHHFPRRNRIIAGISVATIVVEAGMKSGSINTANHANKYGRTVFAAPGFPTDYRSCGTNKLIQDGAIMVTDVHDILDELNSNNYIQNDNLFHFCNQNKKIFVDEHNENLSDTQNQILSPFSSKTDIDIQDLLEFFPEIPFNKLLMALSELEIKGFISRNVNGKYCRIK